MRCHRSRVLLLAITVALAAALVSAGAASAAPEGFTVQPDAAGDRLVRVDLATGTSTSAAAALTDVTGVVDLALHDGTLYGVSVDDDLLVVIDRSDGSLVSSVALGVDASAAGITFTADGTLWMTATVASAVRLYRVDPATGETTEVGLLGTPGAPDISGLTTTCDGQLLGIAGSTQVVRVERDPPNVQPFFPAFSAGPQSLAVDPATEIVWGLESQAPDPGRLWHVDPEIGDLTDTGITTSPTDLRALEIGALPCSDEVQPAAAPEPVVLIPNFTG